MVEASGITAYATGNDLSGQTTATDKSVLGKDDFLKLLITQLKNQDPTSPMDSAQFMAQMADFTTLEQTQNMSAAIDRLVAIQASSALSDEAAMIGKEVHWRLTDKNDDESSDVMSGIIRSVTIQNGEISYLTEDGTRVDPETITEISASSGDEEQSGT